MSEACAPTTRRLERCLACGGDRLRALPLRYEYRGKGYPLAECVTCGMRFLREQPTGESLAALYAAPYFERDFRCGRSEATSLDESAFIVENGGLLDRFDELPLSRPGGAPRRLLEVGCAMGWLLRHAAARGWQVSGVELSAEAAAHARSLGLDVHEGTLESANLPDASADLVYMGDVLEHVPDCRSTLEQVARVLAPGGCLFLRGPITTNSLARRIGLAVYGVFGEDIVLREPPYHLWEFTPHSLDRLVRSAGLEPVACEQAKIPPGRTHGSKSWAQTVAIALLDSVNVPLTRAFNRLGDRIVLIARKGDRGR